ncbi:MAG: molybdenum cofactor guanylyltransferase [Verrucomicrobiales bacterium]|nr:molybdenum cofactor guanylyltransferase [Verrucomicrobiales bacterium]
MNFSAVILAGGKSSRMGRDKAWLEAGGQTLLARQIGLARKIGAAEVFISGRADADYSAFGCRVLQDKFPEAGPLAGIERALDAAKSPLLLVLAVDLPEMSVEFLLRLAAKSSEKTGAIPKLAGGNEPLAAFYPKACHALAVASLELGAFAAKDFAELCAQSGFARFIELDANEAHHFDNWNSPADLP